MIRKLIQTLLCVCLCPLLAAQEVAPQATAPIDTKAEMPATAMAEPKPVPKFIKIPKNTMIVLVAQEAVSSATAKVGDVVRFAVVNDVVVDSVKVIRAGMQVNGTITKVRAASSDKHQNGLLRVRFQDVELSPITRIRLNDAEPDNRIDAGTVVGYTFMIAIMGSVTVAALAVTWPYILVKSIKGGAWHHTAPLGIDRQIPLCQQTAVYIDRNYKVPSAGFAQVPDEATTAVENPCSSSTSPDHDGNTTGTIIPLAQLLH